MAEDGSRRPALGRSGTRFQQFAHDRHRQSRNRAAPARRRKRRSGVAVKRALDNAMRGAQRAAILTQRLLAFSRQQPLDPKPLDVNKFIAAEVEFLQRSLGETIEVEAVGSAGLWPVEVDAHQLEAALLNLAVNAR